MYVASYHQGVTMVLVIPHLWTSSQEYSFSPEIQSFLSSECCSDADHSVSTSRHHHIICSPRHPSSCFGIVPSVRFPSEIPALNSDRYRVLRGSRRVEILIRGLFPLERLPSGRPQTPQLCDSLHLWLPHTTRDSSDDGSKRWLAAAQSRSVCWPRLSDRSTRPACCHRQISTCQHSRFLY